MLDGEIGEAAVGVDGAVGEDGASGACPQAASAVEAA